MVMPKVQTDGRDIVCVHRWSPWFEALNGQENRRWATCSGLCKQIMHEGEPEPRIVIGRLE